MRCITRHSPTASHTSSGSPDPPSPLHEVGEAGLRRDDLIAVLRARLIDTHNPRLVVLVIISLAGAAAFATSVAALRLGLDSMALRYPLATLCGYGAFLALIRLWIAWWREEEVNPNPVDHIDLVDGAHTVVSALPAPGGGPPEILDFTLDLEEGWFLVLAAACVAAGAIALGYVIYIAPLLLAEVALDAALVSAVYRRLRRQDACWWAASVLKRTWLPAVALILFMGVVGFGLQQAAPDARSIGGVMREVAE